MDFKIEPLQPTVKIPGNDMGMGDDQPPKRSIFDLLRFAKPKYLAVGLGAILLISVLFFFFGNRSFREGAVELKIEGPSEVASGELITYKVTYKNNNSADLTGAKLNLLYPVDAIVVKDGNISDLTTENINLGVIGGKNGGEKELTVYIVGDKGNIKTLRATLTYKTSSVSPTFQKDASSASTITSLAVPITLVATPTVISGQNTSYLIDYRNESGQDLENLRFLIKFPGGFTTNKFTPEPNSRIQGQATWDVAKLNKGDGSRITVQGTLVGIEKESKIITVTVQKKITTPNGDIYVDFEKSEASSIISTPLLSFDIQLNESSDYTAHLGDTLRYKINFRNNSQYDISGLGLSVRLEGSMYDFATVQSDGFFDGRLNTIFWNASTVPKLNVFEANQSGQVSFSVNLKKNFSGATGAKDSFVKISARLETSNVPSELDLDKLTTDGELITRISTAPTFDQKILSNDSVFGSSGPFPPKVNQKTDLTVKWNLINPSNDVSSARITATLAPGVKWDNQVRVTGSQIQPTYNSSLSMVTWDLGSLPGGTGISFPAYEAYFRISVTPSINQVGGPVLLLRNIKFEGTDSFTKEKISRTIPDAGTNNVSDNNSGGSVQQ